MIPERTDRQEDIRKIFFEICKVITTLTCVLFVLYLILDIHWIAFAIGCLIILPTSLFLFLIMDMKDIEKIKESFEKFVKKKEYKEAFKTLFLLEGFPIFCAGLSIIFFRFWLYGMVSEATENFFVELGIIALFVWGSTSVPMKLKLKQYQMWSSDYIDESTDTIAKTVEKTDSGYIKYNKMEIRKFYNIIVDENKKIKETNKNVRLLFVPKDFRMELLKVCLLAMIPLFL